MMNMEVNGTRIQVKLYDNSSAEAVKDLLRKGPFTLSMKDYAHMEKFGSCGMQLPANDEPITTEADVYKRQAWFRAFRSVLMPRNVPYPPFPCRTFTPIRLHS